jgi:processive 1,2-diacylglycerol beta-glucosyltransferase
MKRIIILTAGYGEGHNAAARALCAALQELGAEVEIRDLFLETYGEKQKFSCRLYLDCIEKTPWLWALTYKALDSLPLMRLMVAPSLYTMLRRHAGGKEAGCCGFRVSCLCLFTG